MNLKTTLGLLLLTAAGVVLFWRSPTPLAVEVGLTPPPAEAAPSDTLRVLEEELTGAKLRRVELRQGDRVVTLERGADGAWTLPGKWLTRPQEVKELVALLTSLRSRFAPEAAADLKQYGLDAPAVTVTAQAGDKTYRLAFGEPPGHDSAFARPTYLRLDDRPEVVRLAPGLVAALDRPADYYQQRRLFPAERGGEQEPGERLAARSLEVKETKENGSHYALARDDKGEWALTEPARDRPDPDKLKSVLQAVPDVWAEQFVPKPKADLAEYGLDKPEQTVRVVRPNGDPVTLLIGKVSRKKERTELRPTPPGLPPGLPPMRETVVEESRYAKLQDNDQVFEIKADKLKDVFVPAAELRDARLARFRAEDVTRFEVEPAGQPKIVFSKKEERWQIEREPAPVPADTIKVNELLDKLSGLRASDKDVIDKPDAAAHGLDKPLARITVTAEETKGTGDAKKKETKTFTLVVGKHDAEQKKLYVKAEPWPRVNAVEDSLKPLVERKAVAYRGPRVFDFAAADVEKIDVRRGLTALTLQRKDGKWGLATPPTDDVDAAKAGQLASTLGGLTAGGYVSDAATKAELEKTYGLAPAALTATVTQAGGKPPLTLLLGKARERDGKTEYFATTKAEEPATVFVVAKDVHDALSRDSLSYLPTQFKPVPAEEVAAVRVQKQGQPEYGLTRKDAAWQVTGPFEAAARADKVQPLVERLAALTCERYVAHAVADAGQYGLDNPYLRLALAPKDGKERVLLVGKPAAETRGDRFAKLADGPAVFVVDETFVAATDRAALDLLDTKLLSVSPDALERVRLQSGDAVVELQRKGEEWQVVKSPAGEYAAYPAAVTALYGAWFDLKAERFADYGPKVDWAKYGLDKPASAVTVVLRKPAEGEPKPGAAEHTLALGKEVEGTPGARYARLDNGPGVAVLAAPAARPMAQTYLDFVNRALLKIDPASVTALRRQGGGDLELVKRDDGWFVAKPAEQRADDRLLQDLVARLAGLETSRVAAFPASDLKPFGLDAPAAQWTLVTADGEHVVKLGKPTDGTGGAVFVAAGGSKAVGVLPGVLTRRLRAAPLAFRDRSLAKFADADQAVLERGPRKAVFAKAEGTWKMTGPLAAPAEQAELDDLINLVARLRADELVAEKPADLKPYGLDRPEASWRFRAGDQEVLHLLIGAREPNGERRHAKLGGGDLVFLLDAGLSEKLLAEYRGRAVWAEPPDAAQAEGFKASGRNPFALERDGAGWKVVGKPDVRVNARTVNDTVAAFASLRVLRYVQDKDADPKLYGLEPPQTVLEVQTPAGPRALHVGRTEGLSRRYYARVPDKDRSDVFVLSEADAARLLRDLAALQQELPAPQRPAP